MYKKKNDSNTPLSLFPISYYEQILPNTVSSVYVLYSYSYTVSWARQRWTRIVRRCLSPQVAALDFSLDLPFSISFRLMLSLPDFATLYSLILHLIRLENWIRRYRQCQPVPYCQSPAKGGPYNHDGVPKITWIWEPRDAHIYGVCKFLWHRTTLKRDMLHTTPAESWQSPPTPHKVQ